MEFSVPATPDIVIPFLISFAGIGFVILSRNVGAKRLVLPATLVIFSFVWLEGFRRGTNLSSNMLAIVGVGLLVNALWVYRRIAYCSRCGRTHQGHNGEFLCDKCLSDVNEE